LLPAAHRHAAIALGIKQQGPDRRRVRRRSAERPADQRLPARRRQVHGDRLPGAKGTQVWGINDSGQIAGFYLDPDRPMPELAALAAAAADSTSAAEATATADSTTPMGMLADMWVEPAG
jgi:hypothetical protein